MLQKLLKEEKINNEIQTKKSGGVWLKRAKDGGTAGQEHTLLEEQRHHPTTLHCATGWESSPELRAYAAHSKGL